MSSHKYRKLLTNLPSMAAVVNSFQSPDVQLEVYKLLIEQLEEAAGQPSSASATESSSKAPSLQPADDNNELAHELDAGDSIHSISAEDEDD